MVGSELVTNTDLALQELRSRKRQAVATVVRSKRSGAPCPRARLFVFSPESAEISDDDAKRLMMEAGEAINLPDCSVSDWLLPQDDPRVQAWLAAFPPKDPKYQRKFTWWPADYVSMMKELGHAIEIVTDIERLAKQIPAFTRIDKFFLDLLTDRERVCLQCCYILASAEDLENDDVVLTWGLTQNLGRIPHQRNGAPACLPKSLVWVHQGTVQARMLTPHECLLTQGIDLDAWGIKVTPMPVLPGGRKKTQDILPGHFTWMEIMDLCGNAYNMYSLNTAIIITYGLWSGKNS